VCSYIYQNPYFLSPSHCWATPCLANPSSFLAEALLFGLLQPETRVYSSRLFFKDRSNYFDGFLPFSQEFPTRQIKNLFGILTYHLIKTFLAETIYYPSYIPPKYRAGTHWTRFCTGV
jgi:hypothetical protein